MSDLSPALRPDFFGQLAATDPYQRRARRLFERGHVVAVNGNEADLRVGTDALGNALEMKGVAIISGYLPQVGDWVAIQYEAGHSGAPWVTGPSMAGEASADSAGIGVFAVSADAPADPQKSTIYFDDSRAVWRGWDGSEWVDLSAKLHNALPDLQGGSASQYYHFSGAEHAGLQDFYDGSALASGWLKQLKFKAIDASATSRTRLFEKDGDFYWAINAEYDLDLDQWNRIDTSKCAYLIGLYSKNGIPHEPGNLGGLAWWRASPGTNPIGDYTAVGGWELGHMMTEHRNFVGGGMNWELDGSGSPPYGRFSQAGHEDPDNFTGLMRNVWYEGNTLHSPPQPGEGSWGRDTADHPCHFMGMLDEAGFVWRYRPAGAGAFATSNWIELGRLRTDTGYLGRLDLARQSSETTAAWSSFLAKHLTSADMADGFGAGYGYAIQDSAGVMNVIGAAYALRAGADNTGKLSWHVASAGVLAERMSLTAAGVLSITGGSMSFAGSALSVESASALNQDLTSDASPTFGGLTLTGNLSTSGNITLTGSAHNVYNSGGNLYVGSTYSLGACYFVSNNAVQGLWTGSVFRPYADATASLGAAAHYWLQAFITTLNMSAGSIVTDTATGLKIATAVAQRLGFFGVTPVVQQSHVADPSGGATVDPQARTAIIAVLSRLEALGLLASS